MLPVAKVHASNLVLTCRSIKTIPSFFQVSDAEGVGAEGAAVPERDRPAGARQALGARHPPHQGARRRIRAQGLQLQETGELRAIFSLHYQIVYVTSSFANCNSSFEVYNSMLKVLTNSLPVPHAG